MFDDKVAAVATASGAIGLIAGMASGILARKYATFWDWARGLIAALVVAVLVGLMLDATDLSKGQQAAAIGVCAFIAADILEGLLHLAALVRADPIGFFRRVRAALKGAPDEPPPPR